MPMRPCHRTICLPPSRRSPGPPTPGGHTQTGAPGAGRLCGTTANLSEPITVPASRRGTYVHPPRAAPAPAACSVTGTRMSPSSQASRADPDTGDHHRGQVRHQDSKAGPHAGCLQRPRSGSGACTCQAVRPGQAHWSVPGRHPADRRHSRCYFVAHWPEDDNAIGTVLRAFSGADCRNRSSAIRRFALVF